jgi:Domain of unknown function (DUF1963)
MDQRQIEALMEEYQQPAIMVHRPYPPFRLPPLNSYLGGRPRLPDGIDWPLTSNGIPLHFLAQIDCAELPPTEGVLPQSGVLYFFARIDEDMIWGEGDPQDDCRVLYEPLGTRELPPPVDLPEVMFGLSGPVVDFKLPDDPPVQLYPRWPVTLHSIKSWPDRSATPYLEKDYQKAVRRARAAEVVRVLGLPVAIWSRASWRRSWLGSLELPTSFTESPFPQLWVMVDRIARHIVKQSAAKMWPSPAKNGPDPNALRDIETAAIDWVAEAARYGLDEAPNPAISERFAKWLQAIATHAFFREKVAAAIIKGMASAVQFAATEPKAAELIPGGYYSEMENDHIPVHASSPTKRPWDVSGRYHQMLGNAGSSQTARPVDRDDILLLQLKSDNGVNFMFCDVGEAEFWINKDDLAARRFDKVSATTCGG